LLASISISLAIGVQKQVEFFSKSSGHPGTIILDWRVLQKVENTDGLGGIK